MFEALCDEGKQTESYKNFIPTEKRRKIHGSVPTPLTGFLFLIAPVLNKHLFIIYFPPQL